MTSIGAAYVDIDGDFTRLTKGINDATRGTRDKFRAIGRGAGSGLEDGLSNSQSRITSGLTRATAGTKDRMRAVGRTAGLALAGGIAVALGGAAVIGKAGVDAASDINESLTKNRTLFGEHAKAIERFSDTSAQKFGISKRAALEYTGVFGNLARATGIGEKSSADLSTRLTTLAADLASFNNTSIEDALEALRSGLVGETEPLRRFGVTLSADAISAEALGSALGAGKAQTDKYRKAVQTATVGVQSATSAQRTAEQALSASQQASRQAQERLTQAREDARRQLDDLKESVGDLRRGEEGARLGLERAQERLAEVMKDSTATDLDRRDALFDVKEAEDRVSDSVRDRKRGEQAATKAQRKGIEGAEQVAAARGEVAKAAEDEQDAGQRVAQAASKTRREQARLAEAKGKLAKTSAAEIGAEEKVMATLAIITRQTSKAQGDFSRTSQGAANQQRIFAARVEDLKAALGQRLLPVVNDGIKLANNLLTAFDKIFGRKDIDLSEKFRLSGELLKEKFRPIAQKLQEAVAAAAPHVQSAAGTLARKAAGAFVKAWLESDWWVKIFTGLYLVKKLGVFHTLGKSAGTKFGKSFAKWGTPLIIGAITAAIFDKQIKGAAGWLADQITGKPPKGFETPEKAAATLRRQSREAGQSLKRQQSTAPAIVLGTGEEIPISDPRHPRHKWWVKSGKPPSRHSGGPIPGSGDQLWNLKGGEHVMNTRAVRRMGHGFFDGLNRGVAPTARNGGDNHFHLTVPGGGTPDWRAGAAAMGDELRRRSG